MTKKTTPTTEAPNLRLMLKTLSQYQSDRSNQPVVPSPLGDPTRDDYIVQAAEQRLADSLNQLHSDALWLAVEMLDLAARIEERGLETIVNSCGEAQLARRINQTSTEASTRREYIEIVRRAYEHVQSLKSNPDDGPRKREPIGSKPNKDGYYRGQDGLVRTVVGN
jgi:hypothetical protein